MAGANLDRGLYEEFRDKPIRLTGASRIEEFGSYRFFDDFDGDTLIADKWLATSTAGGGANNVAFAIDATAGDPVAGHGGWISGTCSDNAAGVEELAGLANVRASRCAGFDGTGLLVFQTRVSLPSIAAVNCSVGLASARTLGNGTAMNISGTTVLVTTAVNAACWLFDTRGTDPDIWYGATVDNNTDSCANTTLAAQGQASTPAATTSYVLRIEMDASGNAFFYQGAGDNVNELTFAATGGRQAAGATTLKDTLLAPYFGIDNAGAGAVKTLEVDYCLVASAR